MSWTRKSEEKHYEKSAFKKENTKEPKKQDKKNKKFVIEDYHDIDENIIKLIG